MRILHTADWHLGKRLEKFSRFEEQILVLNEICEVADEQNVDLVLIAGDLYDTFNPPTEAVELFFKTLKRLSNNGHRAVVAIAGNHDSSDRIAAPDPLARACGIILVGNYGTIVPKFKLESGLEVTHSDKGFIELKLPNIEFPVRLILTPYVNELRLKKALTSDNKELEFRSTLEADWKHIADQYCDKKGVNLLMTHLFFVKSGETPKLEEETDDEKSILYIGGAQPIYSKNVPNQMQYVALGHLHRRQTIDEVPCPIVYSSSPLAYSFSESNQKKYVISIDAEPNKKVEINRIELTQGRKLLRNSFSKIGDAVEWLMENQNALIELTIHSETYLTGIEKRQLLDAHDGIISIIPMVAEDSNQINTKSRVIDPNKHVNQLFEEYFMHKNSDQKPSKELIELFNELKSI